MITCRIPSLALLMTLLSASVAMSQTPIIRYAEPSSRQAATSRASNAVAPSVVAGSPTQTTLGAKTSVPESKQQSGGWLKRLVLGNSEENAPDPSQAKPIEFSSQSSSRHATTTAPSSAAIRPLPPITNSPAQTPSSPPTSQNPAAQVTGTSRDRGNWFQRVVLGQPQQAENKTQSVQLAPQPSSRQTTPLPSRVPSQVSAPIASARPATPVTTSPPAERSDRGWLSRLVLGQNKSDRASTNSTAPPAKPAPAESLATRFGGLPTATTPSSSAPYASSGQSPAVTTHAAPREGSAQLANSLAAANEAAQPGRKIEPNSERSISLTNWISRLRKPDSAEQKPEPSYAHNPFNRPNASDTLQLNQALQQVSPPPAAPMASSRNTSQAANPTPGPTGNVPSLAQNGMASPDSRSLEDSSNSLTNWISRPFRAMTTSDEDKELLTTRLPAPTSKSPVRLPTVAQTVSRPSPSASQRLQAQTLPLTSPAPYAASQPGQDRSATVATAPIATAPPQSMPGGDSYRSIVAPSLRPPQSPAPSDIASLTRQFVPTPAVPTINAPSNATPHIETPNPSYQRTAEAAPPVVAQPVLHAPPRMSLAQLPSSPPAADAEMYPQPAVDQTTDSPLGRPKIIFNPAVRGMNDRGQAVLKPAVQVAHNAQPAEELPPMAFATQPGEILPGDTLPPPADYVGPEGMERPLAEYPSPDYWVPEEIPCEEPMTWVDACKPFLECGYTVLAHLNGPRSCPPGIGVENVMNSLFWIDTTQPLNNCRVRGDAAADLEFPDRLEYFWAKTPGGFGPEPDLLIGEPSVDYQDVSFYIERGGDRFSVGTELPIRAVDPDVRLNTAGFADMKVTTKAVLLDGKEWQLTQVFHTHFPTGSAKRGTGNGHFSLEPGVAWRYKWSDVTYIHGDLTYWFPLGADPDHSGEMFNYGIAISHVWIDSDKWALIPTLELNAWTLLDGRQTKPGPLLDPFDPSSFHEIDTLSILNIHPGLRWVCDTAGDCGVREFGISSGIAVTEDHWYEEILRLELRWVF